MGDLVSLVVDELCAVHGCHTVILYGSYARGDHTEESDIDVLGINEGDRMYREARLWKGIKGVEAMVAKAPHSRIRPRSSSGCAFPQIGDVPSDAGDAARRNQS